MSEIVYPLRIAAFQRFGLNTGNYLEVANTFYVLYRTISEWRNLSIHESSPVLGRGANRRLTKEAPAYVESHYYRGVRARKTVNGIRYVGNSLRGSLEKYNDPSQCSDDFNLTAPRFMKHFFLHRYLAIAVLCVGVVLLLPAVLDRPKYEKYLSATQWETDGAFVANGQPNPRDFPGRILRSSDARFWRNYTPGERKCQADCDLPPSFCADNRVIMAVVGFPNSEDAGIYLESETNHQ